MNELWIPILGVICAVGMPVLLGIIASYMTIKSKHEEKMAMIEKGIVLEEAMRPERRPNRYNTLRNGIFMIGLSLGVIVGMMVDSAFTYDSDWFFLLVPAITIMFGGVAFIIYFFLSRSLMEKERLEDEKKMQSGRINDTGWDERKWIERILAGGHAKFLLPCREVEKMALYHRSSYLGKSRGGRRGCTGCVREDVSCSFRFSFR